MVWKTLRGKLEAMHFKVKSTYERNGVKEYFCILLMIIFLTDFVILLNIPFLRQIIGFLFLTILSGLLILQILKLNKISSTEKIVLLIGLNTSFLMLFGLLINNLSLYFGYETPLSTISLLISFNIAFIVLAIIGYKLNKDPIFSIPNINLSTSEKAFLVVPVLFPVLSIFGMHLMNTTDNNIILMLLLFLIPIYVASVVFFNQKFPKRLYPVVIFLISISLLLMFSLRSNHIIIGTDTGREFYFFRMVLCNQYWNVSENCLLDACLSISLLPTIYHSILNVNEEFIFKVLYSLIFSVSPLVIYIICKKYIGCYYSFLASFFFMSRSFFQCTASLARVNTAILFCALTIMVLFNDRIDPLKKKILFIIFAISIVVSHYSTTYIFFFMLLFVWFGMQIVIGFCEKKPITLFKNPLKTSTFPFLMSSKGSTFRRTTEAPKTIPVVLKFPQLRTGITITFVLLFFIVLFFWYGQLTGAAFNLGVSFIEKTILNLNCFFFMESRSTSVSSILGENVWYGGIPLKINFVSSWMIIVFIAIGVFSMIHRYRAVLKGKRNSKSEVFKTNIEIDYIIFAFVSSTILIAMLLLPFVSIGYSIQRVYLLMMVILSLAYIIGGMTISKHLKVRADILILLVLIITFLCQTGVMSQIFGVPQAITLNSCGVVYNEGAIINDQDCYASKWIANYVDQKEIVHTTSYAVDVLMSQGLIQSSRVDSYLIPTYEKYKKCDGYVYLRYQNVANRKMTVFYPGDKVEKHGMDEYPDMLTKKNEIYTNGDSKVYA